MRRVYGVVCAMALAATSLAEPLPARLAGTWRIARILNTNNAACWSREQAEQLIGSTVTYKTTAMRWRDGEVPVSDITTRTITAREFREENSGSAGAATFAELGIHTASVLEVDMQHEDMDITGATTEVPGDSVLLAGRQRIIVSACGVFMEATRK